MNSIAVTMELILGMLLLAALFVGVKLEKRLKTLREDQAGFAKAVSELNSAVLRAEAGLAELKSATHEAQTTLADRIQDAKGAAARLLQNIAKAVETADTLQAAVERAAAMPLKAPRQEQDVLALTTPIDELRARLSQTRRTPADSARAVRPEPGLSRADLLQARLPNPEPEPAPVRSRARIDDDLFEPPLRLAAGARR
jgi:hypothetical protein